MITNKKKIIKDIDDSYLNYFRNEKSGVFISVRHKYIDHVFTCREEALSIFYDNNNVSFAFYVPKLNINKINLFFSIIEKKLKIKNSIKFSFINDENLVYIELGQFWEESIIRFDFFTLFLRCAAVYFKGNAADFDNSLKRYKLSAKIKHVIDYFLEGNIWLNWNPALNNSWSLFEILEGMDYIGNVNFFKNIKPKQLKWTLIKEKVY